MKEKDKWKRGLPYVGSKGQKAQQIIDLLPAGNRLIDVFGGGGSISLTASDSEKWNEVFYNEKRRSVVELLKALMLNDPHINLEKYIYITREEFFNWKDNMPDSVERTLILLIWSFSNNMEGYLWSKNLEKKKLLLIRGLFYGDTDTVYDDLFAKTCDKKTISEKYVFYHAWRREHSEMLGNQFKQIESIERIQRMNKIIQHKNINVLCSIKDYRSLKIRSDDIVYCDPPYAKTSFRYDSFDNDDFDEWLNSLPTKKIFISEYSVIPNTAVYADLKQKQSTWSNTKNRKNELLLRYIKH